MRWSVVPQPVDLASSQTVKLKALTNPHHPNPGQFQCDKVPVIEDSKGFQEPLLQYPKLTFFLSVSPWIAKLLAFCR